MCSNLTGLANFLDHFVPKYNFPDEILENMSKSYMFRELFTLFLIKKSKFWTKNPDYGPESMKISFETTKMHRISPGIQWNTSRTPKPQKKIKKLRDFWV